MTDLADPCSCGRPSVFLGRCAECFSTLSDSHFDRRHESKASTDGPHLVAGQVCGAGRFTLVAQLGEGGMGTVWLANDEHMSVDGAQIQVALKFLGGNHAPDVGLVSLLRKEVRSALQLSHRHIVRVHSWHEHPGEPVFYSMEFVPGLDLRQSLADHPAGRFSSQELDSILGQLVDALDYAHNQVGVVHRDIKPANLLVTPERTLKLADFGLARPGSSRDPLATTSGGTIAYASPQQRHGEAATPADDIYSLGAVLYHLMTGETPYRPEQLASGDGIGQPRDPRALLSSTEAAKRPISAAAAETVLRCLSHDPQHRPPNVRALWRWWQAGPPASVDQGQLPSPKPAIGSWIIAGVCAAIILVLIAVLLRTTDIGIRVTSDHPALAQVLKGLSSAPTPSRVAKPENAILQPGAAHMGDETSAPSFAAASTPQTALSVVLKGISSQAVRAEVHFSTEGMAQLSALPPAWVGRLSSGTSEIIPLEKAGPGYIEAGEGTLRGAFTWMREEFSAIRGTTQQVTLDFGSRQLDIVINHAVQLQILDGWGGKLGAIAAEEFTRVAGSDGGTLEWRFNRPKYPWHSLLPGVYTVRLDRVEADTRRMEPFERRLALRPGASQPVGITVVPWRHPRMWSSWTVLGGLEFVPIPGEAPFLAARTETSIGQFELFARETGFSTASMESITEKGSTNIGRTWREPFRSVTADHPAVGVSWNEATDFCRWLTDRELKAGRLAPKQRFKLPTDREWGRLAGMTPYPWGTNFPPKAGQGTYAVRETVKVEWPSDWEDFFVRIDGAAPTHRTAPVYSGTQSPLGLLNVGGNAAEWCADFFQSSMYVPAEWTIRPRRLKLASEAGAYRVVRGASWFEHEEVMLRTMTRWAELPETRNDRIGFRVVLEESP